MVRPWKDPSAATNTPRPVSLPSLKAALVGLRTTVGEEHPAVAPGQTQQPLSPSMAGRVAARLDV